MNKFVHLKTFDYLISEDKLKDIVIVDIEETMKMYDEIINKDKLELRLLMRDRYDKGQVKMDIVYLEERDKIYIEQVDKLKRKLKFITKNSSPSNIAFEQKLLIARAVPISTLMEFNRGNFACCPFQKEKTPSFKYYPKNNKFKCFGCGVSGDSIDLVQQLKGLEFMEALETLI